MIELLTARKKALQAKQKVERTVGRAERIIELDLMINKAKKMQQRVLGYVDSEDLKRFDLGYAASCQVFDKIGETAVPVYVTQSVFKEMEF